MMVIETVACGGGARLRLGVFGIGRLQTVSRPVVGRRGYTIQAVLSMQRCFVCTVYVVDDVAPCV
jgi:hypothetical protein